MLIFKGLIILLISGSTQTLAKNDGKAGPKKETKVEAKVSEDVSQIKVTVDLQKTGEGIEATFHFANTAKFDVAAPYYELFEKVVVGNPILVKDDKGREAEYTGIFAKMSAPTAKDLRTIKAGTTLDAKVLLNSYYQWAADAKSLAVQYGIHGYQQGEAAVISLR